MADDADRFWISIKHLKQVRTLHSLLGVVYGIYIGCRGKAKTLHAHPQPCLIHHDEHGPHALVLFAKKLADAVALGAEGEGCGGVAVDAHFFFKTGALNVVEFSNAAVLVNQEFGNKKEGYAFGAGGSSFDAGQNRMDDVVRQVMVSAGDEYFVAGDGVGAVIILFGCGGKCAHVGACFRLGETHGACPFSGVDVFQEDFFLSFRAKLLNKFATSMGESGVHHEGAVGTGEHLACSNGQRAGHALSTVVRVVAHGEPFPFAEEFVGFVKGFRYGHLALFQGAPLFVSLFLSGQNLFDGKVSGLAHNHINGFFVKICKCLFLCQLGNI